jgi:hypothetical protein
MKTYAFASACLVPYVAPTILRTNEDPFGPRGIFTTLEAYQNIRCLPAKPGSLVAFSHRLLHWGSRASADAPHPRIAVSLAFTQGGFEPPFLPRACFPLPSWEARLALIAGQLFSYSFQTGITKVSTQILTYCIS